MSAYRKLFHHESVYPKLHYLEHHVCTFIRKWRIGPGLMGEHGGESVHHQFNQLNVRFAGMPVATDRLLQMMKSHLQLTNPDIREAPTPAKRKKKWLISVSFSLSFTCLSVCLSVCFLPTSVYVWLSGSLFLSPSLSLSLSLSLFLFLCLSVCMFVCLSV